MNFLSTFFLVVLYVALAIGLGALFAYPVMLLWNGCLVGAVAGVSAITWLQAWGLMILCSFLFKTYSVSK